MFLDDEETLRDARQRGSVSRYSSAWGAPVAAAAAASAAESAPAAAAPAAGSAAPAAAAPATHGNVIIRGTVRLYFIVHVA